MHAIDESPDTPIVVSRDGKGDFDTVQEAVAHADPGSKILIRAGEYDEVLRLDKPLELAAEGPAGRVSVMGLQAEGPGVVVDGLKIQGISLLMEDPPVPAVLVSGGKLELRNCMISSESASSVCAEGADSAVIMFECKVFGRETGVLIRAGAKAQVENCRITGCYTGVICREGSLDLIGCTVTENVVGAVMAGCRRSSIVDCTISAGQKNGVEIHGKCDLTLRSTDVFANGDSGILVCEKASASIEFCEIYDNDGANVVIRDESAPNIRSCRMYGSRMTGVSIREKSEGYLEDCEIFENADAGIAIAGESCPTIRQCRIHHGEDCGIRIHRSAEGLILDCDISANVRAGIAVTHKAKPIIRGCTIHDGQREGIVFGVNADGQLEQCVIERNKGCGISVTASSNPRVRNCRILDHLGGGVQISGAGRGLFQDCDIHGSFLPAVVIGQECHPVLRKCSIRGSRQTGVNVIPLGQGVLDECEVSGNEGEGILLGAGSLTTLLKCRLIQNEDVGCRALTMAGGCAIKCDLTGNGRGPMDVEPGARFRWNGSRMDRPQVWRGKLMPAPDGSRYPVAVFPLRQDEPVQYYVYAVTDNSDGGKLLVLTPSVAPGTVDVARIGRIIASTPEEFAVEIWDEAETAEAVEIFKRIGAFEVDPYTEQIVLADWKAAQERK